MHSSSTLDSGRTEADYQGDSIHLFDIEFTVQDVFIVLLYMISECEHKEF